MVGSGSWWWTGKPGVLQSPGSQRVGHDWATKLNWATKPVRFLQQQEKTNTLFWSPGQGSERAWHLESVRPRFKCQLHGSSLVGQWLRLHASTAGSMGSVPFRELRSHMPWSMAKKKRKCQLHCRPAVCVHASDYLSELCFPCAIRPKQANNKPLLSSKYLGHVKISLITSIMYFKVGFWIYITTVHQLYLISLLGSRHSMAAE